MHGAGDARNPQENAMTARASVHVRLALLLLGLGLVLAVGIGLSTPARAATGGSPPLQDKPSNDFCLGCHSQAGMSKALTNGDTLVLTIDPETFKHGVHNEENVACVDCHTNITTFPHPAFSAESRRAVTL